MSKPNIVDAIEIANEQDKKVLEAELEMHNSKVKVTHSNVVAAQNEVKKLIVKLNKAKEVYHKSNRIYHEALAQRHMFWETSK